MSPSGAKNQERGHVHTDPGNYTLLPRIDFRRRSSKPEQDFYGRIFAGCLSLALVERALMAAVTSATVTFGHADFARGAKRNAAEVSSKTLPTRVEFMGAPIGDQDFAPANRDAVAVSRRDRHALLPRWTTMGALLGVALAKRCTS